MQQAVVSARNLKKRYGSREVIRGVDFDIPAGICFGILGPNGAGKTTLIRMLIGLSPISSGKYRLLGHATGDTSIHARIGVVAQQDNLDPDFSVRQNLAVYASYFGLKLRPDDERIEALLGFAELQSRGNDKVSALSGGMRRRLMIARALVNDPDLIVLDEPTTGLDPQARHLIWQRLRSLKNRGKTLILTTHYMEEAAELCDELMVLDHGQILARGEPATLVAEHVEPEVVAIRGIEQASKIENICSDLQIRSEQVGDTLFCYTRDGRNLVEKLAGIEGLTFIHRPASLEDLFLKLTGRDLREEQ